MSSVRTRRALAHGLPLNLGRIGPQTDSGRGSCSPRPLEIRATTAASASTPPPPRLARPPTRPRSTAPSHATAATPSPPGPRPPTTAAAARTAAAAAAAARGRGRRRRWRSRAGPRRYPSSFPTPRPARREREHCEAALAVSAAGGHWARWSPPPGDCLWGRASPHSPMNRPGVQRRVRPIALHRPGTRPQPEAPSPPPPPPSAAAPLLLLHHHRRRP
jgi:hypothetical protein